MATKKAADATWQNIDETMWNEYPVLPKSWSELEVVRVRPNTPAYERVIHLRYHGLADSGFVDKSTMPVESMRLERDRDSLILGCCQNGLFVGTATLNTITEAYPAMAMELEKGVSIDHPYYRVPGVLEFAKLAIDEKFREGLKSVLHFLATAIFVARILHKEHFWQVSRDIAEDIRWRERMGFDYSDGFAFVDRTLNDMPSRIGYMHFPSVTENTELPSIVRNAYKHVMSIDLDV